MAEEARGAKRKLHGRAFYESIGSPKYVLAPMVDQSEFAWRMLTRSFIPPDRQRSLLCYTPMFHARLFTASGKYRDGHFQPHRTPLPYPGPPCPPVPADHLDGNPGCDRPLFVQFCANDPATFLSAARAVSPYCDAVDLNLGCPQGIAKRGHYGSFLQEDWDTIRGCVAAVAEGCDVPVTAKMRVLESKERTLEYAKMILAAGASVICVHGRRREQKGHNTGLADWGVIRYLREQLPRETVIFANGNVLQHGDLERCLEATGADAVMSAEGNLYDPTIFAEPPEVGKEGREYWRGRDGRGGFRMDAVLRRYLDILWKYVLGKDPPTRKPLFVMGDETEEDDHHQIKTPAETETESGQIELRAEDKDGDDGPPSKKKQKRMMKRKQKEEAKRQQQQQPQPPQEKKKQKRVRTAAAAAASDQPPDANLTAVQAHLFHLLRPLVAKHTRVRDRLAGTRTGDMDGYEGVLGMVEEAVRRGIVAEHEAEAEAQVEVVGGAVEKGQDGAGEVPASTSASSSSPSSSSSSSSAAAVERCRRPWFICQPYVRPLPEEALAKGALQVGKKEKRLRLEAEAEGEGGAAAAAAVERDDDDDDIHVDRSDGGHVEKVEQHGVEEGKVVEMPREGLVCG